MGYKENLDRKIPQNKEQKRERCEHVTNRLGLETQGSQLVTPKKSRRTLVTKLQTIYEDTKVNGARAVTFER